jgi:hypothetical protein
MLFKHREKPFYKAYKLAFCLVCLSFSVFAAPKAPGKTILHVTPNPGQVAEALAQISRAVEEKKPELLKNYLCGKIDFLSFLPQQTIKKSINVH